MVNTIFIGQYIQFLRKQQQLSQKNLAEKLGVSFQAVSKWETGENLPDASILLDLADILDTTTDKILSAGNPIIKRRKRISLSDLKEGFTALSDMKHFFGEKSFLYQGAISGINHAMKTDIEAYFKDANSQEALLTDILVEYLLEGYTVDINEIDRCFSSKKARDKIRKYLYDTSLFKDKSTNYRKFRPSFPISAINLVFSVKETPVIADIGSGTGRVSALCIDRAEKLYAIEPNEEMRKTATESLSKYSNYIPIAASAEQTTLEENSVDIIVVSSAYHYFDNEETKKEFKRILKENGYVFLFWDIYEGNVFDEEKFLIDQKYREKKNRTLSGIARETRAEHLFGKGNFKKESFEQIFSQSFEEFFGGWSSASYMPNIESPEYEAFQKDAFSLFSRFAENNLLKMRVQTVCFYGKI
ncbi:MAG: methyltransferase domain-containing protein [Clostridia bacterium]|nr:methyltransferase domain-containing protein [Clostridia bacterium]